MAHEIPAATINNLSQIFKDDGLISDETLTTTNFNVYVIQYTANTMPVCAFSTYTEEITTATLDKLQTVLRNDGVTGATTNVISIPCYGLTYQANNAFAYTISTT
tara:strand:- start:123 stop:437 length:315 start_codon:yes stop_codon:yes gene_type:complete